ARDLARILGGLTLRVVEVRGHGNHGLRDGFTEVVFRNFLHGLKHHGRDFGGGILLAVDLHGHAFAAAAHDLVRDAVFFLFDLGAGVTHEALDGVDGFFGVGNRLTLGHMPDETFAGLAERQDGRRGAMPFRVGNDGGLATFHDGDATVGGTEV